MIYYSHINEDNRVERELFRASGCSTVVAICGSGERVLSLVDDPACSRVMVVDCNTEALELLQLKLAALRALAVPDYLRFIGHYPCTGEERLGYFEAVRKDLDEDALPFWEEHKRLIAKGVLYAGSFEKFLGRVRPFTTAYLGKDFGNIFDSDCRKNHFPQRRWALLRTLFSYPQVYRLAGNRDPAFVGAHADTRLIPAALDETIRQHKAPASFMAHLVFKGTLRYMQQDNLPPSLQEGVLAAIKERLVKETLRVDYYPVDLLEFVRAKASSLKDAFYSLSDILSFVDFDYLQEVVQRAALKGNFIVGRSFLRNRLTLHQLDQLSAYGKVRLHSEQESTGMYQVFSVKPYKQPA